MKIKKANYTLHKIIFLLNQFFHIFIYGTDIVGYNFFNFGSNFLKFPRKRKIIVPF